MATLREELEKKGFTGTLTIKEPKDQIPEIDIRDEEVVKDFRETVGNLKGTLYHPSKARFPYKKKSGKVTTLEVGKIMERVNKNSISYQAMTAIWDLGDSGLISLDELTDILRRNNPKIRRASVGAYLGKFVAVGAASKATIDGKVVYSKKDLPKEVAYAKYCDHNNQMRKDLIKKRAAEEEKKESTMPFMAPGKEMVETIIEKVAEQITKKIVLEVIGKIEVIFKWGG